MTDGRRAGRSDRIWQGAILTSCLVHFCIVAVGWMLISKPDRLIELKDSIRVSLIKPQPVEPPAKEAPPQIQPPSPVVKKQPLPIVITQAQPTLPEKTVVKASQKLKPEPAPMLAAANEPSPSPKASPTKATTVDPAAVPPASPAKSAEVLTTLPLSHPASIKLNSMAATIEGSTKSSDKTIASIRDSYLQRLRERIDHYKRYPLMARKGRQQGVVLVEFELSAAGHLENRQVHESCGHRLLDRAALQAVATAAPFPEVPPQIELIETSFIVPVRFVLSR